MIRDDLIISDPIRKVIRQNPQQNSEPDMEETKEGGDTNSSQSEQEMSEYEQSLIHDSLISSLTPSYLLMSSYNSYISRFEQITSSSGSDSSSSSSSSSSNQTSESEDEDEERKENLSVSISE
ncbi:unnamed protein product (macronuclear) [Paramecium tetraurelia]|uniref:Uncharacterized protein n=1 Tax=Paramecium tetraurelia TaxID=5888 RepID=A0DNC6_PARTE|nr:uncharacterized protein GSPATT00018738001 [Paramecium tetraurelia]CAK84543.1 unnamed protein product [Paramecium tetraurelia]|eukprot:XP_001451940.1 hypothetical protein (macronuclear) [Paramecium tetraurelia strain d4-2]